MPVNLNFSADGCLNLCNENFIRYTCFPRRRKDQLKFDIDELERHKEDIKSIVEELEATDGVERSREVSTWLGTVEAVTKDGKGLLDRLSYRSLFSFCSNYRNGKQVDELLRRTEKLEEERKEMRKDQNRLIKEKRALTTQSTQQLGRGAEKQQGKKEGDPWELFSRSVRGGSVDISDLTIKQHAKSIVFLCQGLPLALAAVGRAVRNYHSSVQWETAICRLNNPPDSRQPHPARPIESILRFCYDSLPNDRLRSCLLFCSLFPKNDIIVESELIFAMIGEGLLDGEDDSSDYFNAYEKGRDIIRKLIDASLLEYSRELCDFYLRMPGDVWDMALQISDGEGNPYVIYTKKSGQMSGWDKATRVSIIELDPSSVTGANMIYNFSDDGIRSTDASFLPEDPCYRKLKTMFARGNEWLKGIHRDFFHLMPALRVLDLSCTCIEEIPRTIMLLHKLQYLNLNETKIQRLPIELGELQNLNMLNLTETKDLKEIPAASISRLSALQSLLMEDSGYSWEDSPVIIQDQKQLTRHSRTNLLKLDDLQGLRQMHNLWLTIRSTPTLEQVLSSFSAITGLTLMDDESFTEGHAKKIFARFPKLHGIHFRDCTRLERLEIRRIDLRYLQQLKLSALCNLRTISTESRLNLLRHLGIWGCDSLKDLTWAGQLPALELVCLDTCEQIQQLIATNDEEHPAETIQPFPKLQFLVLQKLPQLSSFSWQCPLLLPSLRTLRINGCPMLRKLPLGSESGKNIIEIRGPQEWWNDLQWDADSIRLAFLPHFRPR